MIVINGLTRCLKDEYATVRISAAEALAKLGSAVKTALPALKALQTDKFRPVRAAATRAITALSL